MNRPDHIAATGPGRLYRGQTAVDFYGHRRIGLVVAIIVVVVTITSLFVQGLNLGLDFEGGQAWDVPASEAFGVDEAEDVLRDNDVPVAGSKIQLREAESLSFVAVQIEVVPTDQAQQITDGFAAAAGVDVEEISFAFTSSSWGDDITQKAVRALVIFLIVVAIFISIRFADGHCGTCGDGARRVARCRGVHRLPVRGNAGDGHSVPDDLGILPVRHDRGVRPRAGERGQVRKRADALCGRR